MHGFPVLIFFHPDCNCWFRSFTESAPAVRQAVADCTASGDLHPALKTKYSVVFYGVVYVRPQKKATPNFAGNAALRKNLNYGARYTIIVPNSIV